MNDVTRRRVDGSTLFTGLVLIGVGMLFLLDRLDVADFGYVTSHYWPLIIVAFGISKILRGTLWPGLWMITIGTWLQVVRLRLFGLNYSSSWPLLLIALGAGMVVRTIVTSMQRRDSNEA